MPKLRKKSVLLDTSFLITLFDDGSRANHDNAKKYYKYFIENKIDMYISTIVASEYSQKEAISEILDTGNFITATFNMADGILTGEFAKLLFSEAREATDSRAGCKGRCKTSCPMFE